MPEQPGKFGEVIPQPRGGSQLRPGSGLSRDLSQYLFPFEAWEFSEESAASPELNLKSPWVLKADNAIQADLTGDVTGNITGDVTGDLTGHASEDAPVPTASATVGQWKQIDGTSGSTLSLPAGGTWAYITFMVNASTSLWGFIAASVAAGGTQIQAGSAGWIPHAWVWRVT